MAFARALLIASSLALLPLTASAQNAQTRQGFWFTLGLGSGSLGCQDCYGRENGGSANIGIGGTLSQHVTLGAMSHAWVKEETGVKLQVGTFTAAARYYPSATGGFFLTGGLGLGSIDLGVSGYGNESRTGAGAMLGIGIDIRIAKNTSITPYFNSFAVSHDGGDANVRQFGLAITVH